jgi:hypothetical protein
MPLFEAYEGVETSLHKKEVVFPKNLFLTRTQTHVS